MIALGTQYLLYSRPICAQITNICVITNGEYLQKYFLSKYSRHGPIRDFLRVTFCTYD